VPQLRDVTVNQGLGAYSPLVNGKETLARFYLSKPSCAGSGASIQVTGGTLAVKDGGTTLGTVPAPTPVPVSSAYPEIATFSVAAMADSTGDPKFVIPASMVTRTSAFTASFSATITYRQRASNRASYASASVTFTTRPATNTPISASFDQPSNALGVLFVPMGDGSKTYSTQWTTTGQQALQDGMTAAVARAYPLAAGIGNLGGTGGLRYAVAPTLLDLKRLSLLDANGKFCGTGGSYDKIKAELAQFRLSYNTVNPGAQANRVVGVIDPSIALLPPNPCFEGMAVVNSQEAWAVAGPGRAGQLIGLELAHTLGLVPPARESPFDGAHSQNITAENPQANRRFNVIQRSFIPSDRSLMKPSATSPTPDNVNTLLEVPDFAFLLCVLGGSLNSECQTYGQPDSVDASAPVGSTLAFVMSGTTDGSAGICATCTGAATSTTVIESYFASSVPLTTPDSTSTYRLVQRASGGAVVSDQGVPLSFRHSEHGTGSGSTTHDAGLFSFALPFQSTADRIELWKGSPGASGSLLLYAQNRTAAPVVTSFAVGAGPILLSRRGTASALAVETLTAEAATPAEPTPITTESPLSAPISFGNSFSTVSQVCLNFHFFGDLLDPGEELSTSWGVGFLNGTASPQQDRLMCLTNEADTNRLLDGSEPLTVSMDSGSVTLGALVSSVTGDSTAPVSYRISSDATLYTVAQGGSVPVDTTVTDDPDSPDEPDVTLTSRALVPSGSFSTTPSGGVPSFASDGTLSTSPSTALGDYHLVVTAKGGGFTRSYDVDVTVVEPTASLVVNTAADDAAPEDLTDGACEISHCTLREAITVANDASGANTIEFDLPLSGGTQIAPTSALPPISDTVLIDGDSQPEGDVVVNGDGAAFADGFALDDGSDGSTIRGIEIRDFSNGAGIRIGSANNTIVSNTIHDTSDGIVVSGSDATANVIGDNVGPSELFSIDYALGNVLVNNFSDGLEISSGATGTVVAGNFIGTDRVGTTGLGNDSTGIRVAASGNQLGPGNTVTHNGSVDTGIFVASGSGNRIVANSIHDNLGLGISLGEGANNDLGAPALSSATSSGGTTTVQGSISGPPAGDYFVEFFRNGACDASDFGEGETYLDFATVSVSGPSTSFSKSLGGLSIGDVVTVTLTSTATNDTSEFSSCVTVEEEEELPPGQESWDATATDDNAADMRLDGLLDCPGQPVQVIFVGRAPNSVSGNTATWSGTIDTSLAPPNCAVKIAVNDGFTRPPITDTGTETAATGNNPVVAAVSSPRANAQVLQYGVIPLRGSIFNAQGVLGNSEHAWSLSGPGITRSGTGPIVDLQPPTGGWPAGTYTATLKRAGSTDPAESDNLTFIVLTDADNDGIPKSVDDGCIGGNGDSDPLNAFGDKDNDGLPNASDPQPCTAATSYTAIVDVNPDPLPTGSSGNPITADVRVPGRNVAQVLASSVRITRIADEDVSTNNDFKNIGWTIKNGVGIAKFDREKIAQWLASRDIHNRVVSITVGGSSGAPPWTFSGSDSVFVQG
jgi:CSLREA domain-containing protein